MSEFEKIEEKWQARWDEEKVFESDPAKKKKFFITVPYPYVNGAPHMGHAYSFLRGDVYARFKRMQGYNVLLPQGFHATGEPILGVVERLKKGDQDQVDALKALGTSDDDIKKFEKEGPEFVANYWMDRWMYILRRAGYSADWRRTFITAITPAYGKFIQWQYRTLKKKGYVVQGTHPVIWCPSDKSPTGDHDRLVGEGESPVEYTVVKFKTESGDILPCATLRPETVYGATNLWLNPDGKYVRATVGNETWILGEAAVDKLKDQMYKVKVKGSVKASDLIPKKAKNPVTGDEVPILPASFVDSTVATGVVMSVPSHAPYDWVGLHNLREDKETAKKFKISSETLYSVAPISIIKVDGFDDNPAIETVDEMLIEKQSEKEKLDEATSLVYKKEFHGGVMKDNTDYPGVKVSVAKDKVAESLVKKKKAVKMWETTSKVVCRCKTDCHVKILENQWFLKFSDKKWKSAVKRQIKKMDFYPEMSRTQFVNTVDWLKDKACARKSGLGTKLPWDHKWIVETLSDSVIYMAYYAIAHTVAEHRIASKLDDHVFDYVFLGKGTAAGVARKSGIKKDVIAEMKRQFDYYYPVDVRFSGKDLIQNHLTYFLFHHTAIWSGAKRLPKSVAVNGYVTLSGKKMSKRFGNVTRFMDLIEKYGADVVRLNLVGANENMDDADWREDSIESFRSRITMIHDLISGLNSAKRKEMQNIDSFLLSKTQGIVDDTTAACGLAKFRSALQSCFFDATNTLKWYVDRCGGIENCNKTVLKEALATYVSMLSPFMPHIAEEMWESLGKNEMVATSKWPKPKSKHVDEKSEMGEKLVAKVIEDVHAIKRISKIEPKNVTVIVAPQWKFVNYKLVAANKKADFKEILSTMKEKDKDSVKYVQSLCKKPGALPKKVLSRKEQFDLLNESKEFLEKQLSTKITIADAEGSNLQKAKNADVQKPAILLE